MARNPFTQELIKMKVPDEVGGITCRGFSIEISDDGEIEVPADMVPEMESHGCTKIAIAAPPAAPVRRRISRSQSA